MYVLNEFGILLHCCPKQHRTVTRCIEDRGFESWETGIWD
jgi:hypothetical protein